MAEVVESCNRFAFDLRAKLAGSAGNLFFSPGSISTALAMTYAGAAGETAREMAAVLHLALPEKRLHEAFCKLRKDAEASGADLRVANRLWGQRGYHFLPEFLETTQRYYEAGLAAVDFLGAEEACRQINSWVEEQTVHRIKELIPIAVITPLTRLILVNAIYFKGAWLYEFDEANTREAPFWTSESSTEPIVMMRQIKKFRYGEFDDLQVLELPYRRARQDAILSDNDLAMVILLPRRRDGLAEIESRLSSKTIRQWTSLATHRVEAWIPKFRIESAFRLDEALKSLGMPKAFSDVEADFSRMTDDPVGLYIAAAVHKAFVEVNEQGTEAAAASAVVMALRGLSREPKIFRADHPFLFLIRDLRTGLIHFMGRVMQPTVG